METNVNHFEFSANYENCVVLIVWLIYNTPMMVYEWFLACVHSDTGFLAGSPDKGQIPEEEGV